MYFSILYGAVKIKITHTIAHINLSLVHWHHWRVTVCECLSDFDWPR